MSGRVCIHTRRSVDVAVSSLRECAGRVSTCTWAAPLPEGQPGSLPGPSALLATGNMRRKGAWSCLWVPVLPPKPIRPPTSPQGRQLCSRCPCTLPAPTPPGRSACLYDFLMGEFINMRSLSKIHRRCISVLPLTTSFVNNSHTRKRSSW